MANGKHHLDDYSTKPFSRKAVDYLAYLGFRALEKPLTAVPHRPARKLGRFLGWVGYWLDGRHRRVAMKNLRMAFSAEKSPKEIRDICRGAFMHLGETAVDLLNATDMNRENKDEYFIFDTAPGLDVSAERDKMISTNRGLVAISAHLGSQEMLVGYVLQWGVGRENIVTKRIKNPYLDRYLQEQREKLGVHVIPHRRSTKEIIKRMQSGEITVFLLDQRASMHEGARVKFFGEYVIAHKAIAQLAMALKLDTFPIFAIKNGDGRYRLIVQEKLELIDTGDMEADIVANTQLFQSVIEKMVRQYPEQWLWMHDRWKHGERGLVD